MREFRLDTVGPAGDCAVLRVTGEVDVYFAPMLRERIRELAASGAVHLIADLGAEPLDAGDLSQARHLEAMAIVIIRLLFSGYDPHSAFAFASPGRPVPPSAHADRNTSRPAGR